MGVLYDMVTDDFSKYMNPPIDEEDLEEETEKEDNKLAKE